MPIRDLELAETPKDKRFIEVVNAPFFTAAELRRDYEPEFIARWFNERRIRETFLPSQILAQTMGYHDLRGDISQDDVRRAYEDAVWADACGMNMTGKVWAQRSRSILRAVETDGYLAEILDANYMRHQFYEAIGAERWAEAGIRLESAGDRSDLLASISEHDIFAFVECARASMQAESAMRAVGQSLDRLRDVFRIGASSFTPSGEREQACQQLSGHSEARPVAP